MTYHSKIGDVFLIPLDNTRSGVGQVIDVLDYELYLAFFSILCEHDSKLDMSQLMNRVPVFSALSLDGKLYNGDWQVIGNMTSNIQVIDKPCYKIRQNGEYLILNYRGVTLRTATEIETQSLRYRTTISPAWLQDALQAHHGIGEWKEVYHELDYSYALRTSKYWRNGS